MSDAELVKQGRAVERDLNNGFPMTCEKGRVIQEMASRIEALTAKLDNLQDRLDAANKARAHVMKMAVKKQAKLFKAVEAFEKLARLGNGDRYGNSDGNMIARATLAEIEGEQT
jgi:exonuclease VII small subunit